MIWSISWRNVWRNKIRSGVVIMAISLGVFAGVFSMAFMRGMANQRLKTAIMTQVSHIQMHTPEFLDVNDIDNYFTHADSIVNSIDQEPEVVGATKRIIVSAIVNSASKGTGIKLIGVDPALEKRVTDIDEKVTKGNFLAKRDRGIPVLIGKKLSETLDVDLDSKIVAGIIDAEGNPIYYQLRIGGIYETTSSAFEESNAFLRYSDLREITGLQEGIAHELAILLQNEEQSAEVAGKLSDRYPELTVREWKQIMPELSYLTETMDMYMYIFIFIILLALGFGIVNTMLMVVLERVKELGMLMAVGMNQLRVFSMIMLESVFLSLTGGVIGIFLGTITSKIFEHVGLNLSGLYGEGFSALGYSSIVYTVIKMDMIVGVTLLVILTGILASIYPAIKALKLNPAEAITTDV